MRRSTKGEGHERRYFYGSVWAVTIAQPVLWLLWKVLPQNTISDVVKLGAFVGILAFVGNLARLGVLPRTRRLCPANSRCRTDDMTAPIDGFKSATLKDLRERWWTDDFTEFLAETLRPRPGNRILDVGCGQGLAEVSLGRLHISQVRLVGIDLAVVKVVAALQETSPTPTVGLRGKACQLPFRDAFDSLLVAVLHHIVDEGAVAESPGQSRMPDVCGGARQSARYLSVPTCRREAFALSRQFLARDRRARGRSPIIRPEAAGTVRGADIDRSTSDVFRLATAYAGAVA